MKKQTLFFGAIVIIIVATIIVFKYSVPQKPQANLFTYEPAVFDDGSIPTTWENAGFTDPAGFKKFFQDFQALIANNDKEKIAQLIQYPIATGDDGIVSDGAAFVKNYDTIFSQKIKDAVKNQNIQQIWRNDQGAMIGNGQLWFSQVGDGVYKIITINN